MSFLYIHVVVRFSMIEMMEVYTNELEERVNRSNNEDMELTPDSVTPNLERVYYPSSGELVNFANCKMAVMMVSVDSATAESGNDWNLMDAVRESVTSLVGEVIVVEEAWNWIIVAVGTTPQPTESPVAQLLALARQVINKVYNTDC